MTSSKFFRFPLRCLRLDKSLHEVTDRDRKVVLSRCLNLHLHHAMQKIDPEGDHVAEAADEEAAENDYTTTNSERWSDDEIRLLYASKLSGVSHGQKHLPTLLKQIEKDTAEFNSGSFVVMPPELFWEAVRNWNFREFACLCSVWAAIGKDKKPFKVVSFDRIIRGSLGYFKKDFPTLPEKVEPLSRRQVRTTVDKLEAKRFFVRCPVNKRHTAYSKTLGLTELQRAIAEDNAKRSRPGQAERLREVERLTALIASSEAEKQPASKQQPQPTKAIQQQPVEQQPVKQQKQQPIEIEKPKSDRKATTPAKASKLEVSPAEKNVMARVPKIQPSDQDIAATIQALERMASE